MINFTITPKNSICYTRKESCYNSGVVLSGRGDPNQLCNFLFETLVVRRSANE